MVGSLHPRVQCFVKVKEKPAGTSMNVQEVALGAWVKAFDSETQSGRGFNA